MKITGKWMALEKNHPQNQKDKHDLHSIMNVYWLQSTG